MNDELREIQDKIFSRAIVGAGLIGLTLAFVSFFSAGLTSAWFIRAAALLIVVGVSFAIRRTSNLTIAIYVFLLELTGLVAEILLHSPTGDGFAQYLFIPLVILAGLLISAPASLAITALSILLILLIPLLSGQLPLNEWPSLLPAISLTLLAAGLTAESSRHIDKLNSRMLESRWLLKERTLKMIHALKDRETLTQEVNVLHQQVSQTKAETQQAYRQLKQRNEILQALIKGTTQDLDTTINKLEQSLEQIAESPEIPGQAELLAAVWSKINRLDSLTLNLTELTKLEQGQISLNYQRFDIERLISEVVGTVQGLARDKPLTISHKLPPELPPLLADPDRLRQVLLHVLSNAVTYTDRGLIEVQAELHESELTIFVSDTGQGIPRDEHELVFRRFGRSSTPGIRFQQGAGLGLAISERLIELHGGRMWVSSVPSVGSTFYMVIPLEPPAKQRVTPVLNSSASLAHPHSKAISRRAAPRQPAPVGSRVGEQTLISQSAKPPPPSSREPVWRFGSAYTRRSGFVLLALLLLVVGLITVLAVVNGPPDVQESLTVTATPLAGVVPAQATASDQAVALPSLTSTLPPTHTPSATTTPVEPFLPPASPIPPSATATATATPPPHPSPSPSATASPTATPFRSTATPTLTPDQSGAASPGLTTSQGALSFVTDPPELAQTSAIEPVSYSRLSWSSSGQLLFAGEEGGNREIYLAGAANDRPRQLTTAAGDDLQPAWSPDGRQIAFSSGRNGNFEIYVMAADGRNLRQLTASRGFDEWPVWSPDGEKIAFVSDRSGNVELYTMNVDGSGQQQLTNDPADDWPATWSPDGRWLVFGSNRAGSWDLYVIPAAGGDALPLTTAPGSEREPAWSPDGQTIAFTYNTGDNWDIYTLPAPSESVRVVPQSAWRQVTSTPVDERYPAWSPPTSLP